MSKSLDRKTKIVELHNSGATLEEIGAQFNISARSVRVILDGYDFHKKKQAFMDEYDAKYGRPRTRNETSAKAAYWRWKIGLYDEEYWSRLGYGDEYWRRLDETK